MSRDFNGTTGQLGLPISSILRPSAPLTFAAWIRPDTLSAGQGIFTTNKTDAQHRGAWFCISDASGHLEISFGDNQGGTSADRRSKVSTGAVTTGSWQHVAASFSNATDMVIYIGGADAGGSTSGTGGNMAYNTGVAGRIGMMGGVFFDGRIAEVGVWTVQLSDAEVLALAKGVSPLRIRPGSLLAYWPVYGAADPEIDLSVNSQNTASIAGAALADHAPVGCPIPMPG